jgi:diguanylate cyclase (GGDEF)-like protein
MNRRRHPRLVIDHSAIFEFDGMRFESCRVRNVSKGGVYMQYGDPRLRRRLRAGDIRAHVRGEAVLETMPEGIRGRVSIVHSRPEGLGLALHEDDALRVFDVLTSSLPASEATDGKDGGEGEEINPSRVIKLLRHLRDRAIHHIVNKLPDFFTVVHQDLLAHTESSFDSRDRLALVFAINCLQKNQAKISDTFRTLFELGFSVLHSETDVACDVESDLPSELALVDKQDIDVWILVNNMAQIVEADVQRTLYQLEVALSFLCHENVRNELNPFSPISLLTVWKKVIDGYDLDIKTIQIILKAFHKTVLDDLNAFYMEVLNLLRREGLQDLPDQSASLCVSAPTHESTAEQLTERSVRILTSLANLHRSQYHSTEMEPGLPVARQDEVLSKIESLSLLQGNTSIRYQLERQLEQEYMHPVNLPEEALVAIGACEELVASLCKDPLITPELRRLLSRLKLLTIEAVLQDPGLLENPDHDVRCMLGTVESMSLYMSVTRHHSFTSEKDREQLSRIVEAVETGKISKMGEVTRELEQLHRELRQRFEKNRELAVSHCTKDECLKQAHASAYEALSNQLLGRSVSVVIETLFGFGWANLLVQTQVLTGKESAKSKAYLRVITILRKLFAEGISPQIIEEKQVKDLISLIRSGFRDYPVFPMGSRRFVFELQQALIEGGPKFESLVQQRVEIDEAYLRKQFSGMRAVSLVNDANKEIAKNWWDLVGRLGLGDWLEMKCHGGESAILNLAWKNDNASRYLLVDGEGYKSLDANRETLARLFESGEISLMQNLQSSIIDRAINRILVASYNEARGKSAIDNLTGLINRHTFELELKKRISGDLADEREHVLVLLDLDKFQVVNDLCGLEGGDNLLRMVASILVSYLPENSIIARMGDDEFSVLLVGYSLEQGYQTAEILRQAIDEYQYEWKGQLIPVSASVGVVHLSPTEKRRVDLMKAALAACIMAKKGGRNNTRIYLASDSAYQDQQQIIRSLPVIKEALTKGHMELFVQPIVSLRDDDKHPHFEILLRIRNESGELECPQAFIAAAEQYDMMRAVDRWVVEAFFKALAPFEDDIESATIFSINLSGKSLGDSEFRDFLKRKILALSNPHVELGFEITETAVVGDLSESAAFMEEIRQLDCFFSLDDFGSGYATFSYMKDLPVDFVKIDGNFVREILNKPADYAMINSITEIAHYMEKQVIAEFVFNDEIAQVLKSIGVDYAQGYHFGHPRPLKDLLGDLVRGTSTG